MNSIMIPLPLKAMTAGHKTSEVSGLPRLYYDRSKPYTKTIKYFDNYKPTVFADKPVPILSRRPGKR